MTPHVPCGAGITVERAVACRMTDGVVLYADHYYPATPGPHPTLLMRQPYGRDIASTVVYAHPVWWARQGYNVVIQDVRGRGDSEGDFYPFRHERRDGADTIAQIRQRPEATGDVGMYGFSYQGMTQLLAAAERPEGLKCIAPAMAAHDLYHGWFYRGGALRLASTLGWGLQMLKEDARRRNLHQASDLLERTWANLPTHLLHTPYAEHPALQDPNLPTYVQDWLQNDRPGPFWSALDLTESLASIEVPALHLSGWYDTYLGGTIAGFLALRAQAGTEHARQNQYLLAGPWLHIPWADRLANQPLGPAANFDTDAYLLRWFDRWLKGTGSFAQEPPIRHFALDFATSQGQWHESKTFGSPCVFHLHSQGRANSAKGDGALHAQPPHAPQPPDVFIYDPEVPVPAPGGPTAPSGPFDQSTLEMGNNLLVYTSAPLTAPLHIFGTPTVDLHAATSAPQADFVAKLICLSPTGHAHFVCLGITRSTSPPDTIIPWHIALEPTSCRFAPGDRIRLEIASSAYPLYDRNPGTAMPPRLASPWNWCRSTQTVYHDPHHPSTLTLPVVAP